MKKIPDRSNTKEYYRSYLKKKKKLVKSSKTIAQQQITIEKPNIVDIKSAIMKLKSAIITLVTLYRVKQYKCKHFLNEKSVKITKKLLAYRGYTSTYNVECLNSFNFELLTNLF